MSAIICEIKEKTSELLLTWCRAFKPVFAENGALELDKKICYEQYQISEYEGALSYNQFVHLAHLLLSEGIVPGADEDEKDTLRNTALANIQYNLDTFNDNFESALFTRGKYLGHTASNWANYYLLRSLEIVDAGKLGSESFRSELQTKVKGACGKIYEKYLEKEKSLRPEDFNKYVGTSVNHVSWYMLLLYSAGIYFGNDEWKDFGFNFMKKYIIPFQDEFGCWPEGGGIVVGYSMTTAQAVSSFAELSEDEEAKATAVKYIGFASLFSMPDGTNAVCADCRQTYSDNPFMFLPASFLRSEKGCQLCLQRISTKLEKNNYLEIEGDGQGLGFFSEFVRILFTKEFSPKGIPVDENTLKKLPVRKISSDPWTATISTQINEEQPGRYGLDTQNFIEIFHNEKGYLVGGGNSKYLPRCSTIRRKTRGRPYIPERAEFISATVNEVEAAYYFDKDRIDIKVSLGADCRITFKMTEKENQDDIYEGALFLQLKKDEVLTQDEGKMIVDPEGTYRFGFDSEKGPVKWRGLEIVTTAEAASEYPIPPYNPYRLDTLPPKSKYCARLGFEIPEEGIEIIFSENN